MLLSQMLKRHARHGRARYGTTDVSPCIDRFGRVGAILASLLSRARTLRLGSEKPADRSRKSSLSIIGLNFPISLGGFVTRGLNPRGL